jgi:hypothetical protein
MNSREQFDDKIFATDLRVGDELHLFGHVHSGYGCIHQLDKKNNKRLLINAALCDESTDLVKKPVLIDFDNNTRETKFIGEPDYFNVCNTF